MATTHPNPELHKILLDAAKQGKLTPELIQKHAKSTSLPICQRDASAYINWNTTLSLLGRAPAQVWFAGVSNGNGPFNIIAPAMDKLRDNLSVGVYYYWNNVQLPATSAFFIEVHGNMLFIDIYDGMRLVAAFDGTPTMNIQIQGGEHIFCGEGVWGQAK